MSLFLMSFPKRFFKGKFEFYGLEKALKVGRQNFGKAKRFRRWLLYIRKRRCRAAVGTYRTIKIVCKCAVFSIYDRSGKNQDFGVGGIDFHRREVLVVGIFPEG